MYLKLSGIEGTSSSDDHQGEFEILSWSFGASNPMTSRRFGSGGGAGKVTMEEFRFVDATNSASPELAAALIAGKRIPTAVLSVTKPADGGRQDYLKVTLSDILISSYQVQGAEDESPKEEVSFDYSRIFFNIVRDDKTVVSSSFNNGAARSRFIPGESLLDVTIPPPSSDGTIHIQLEGVKGESTNQDHKGELRVESFRWGMSIPSSSRSSGGGGGAGKVSFSDLHLSLNTSSASPALLDYLATGKHIPTAVITYTESGQDGGVYDALTIKLSDILVSSYRTRGDTSNGVVNDVALKFRTGEFTVVDDVFAGL